uniref:Ribosome recycling factor domain-containing protein n=1 Tax=Quercus lobata TaxID=97700 RepID=A0A7N2KX22_QUELO
MNGSFLETNLKGYREGHRGSDLGMTPNNNGKVIRLTLPQLTSERRKSIHSILCCSLELNILIVSPT